MIKISASIKCGKNVVAKEEGTKDMCRLLEQKRKKWRINCSQVAVSVNESKSCERMDVLPRFVACRSQRRLEGGKGRRAGRCRYNAAIVSMRSVRMGDGEL